MSKRTLRRAAERQVRKAENKTQVTAQAAVAQNRRSHGLTGSFTVLAWENGADFESLIKITWAEYQPRAPTEHRLVHSLIQHYWLTQRAIHLQENLFEAGDPTAIDGKQFSLFLRYQTTQKNAAKSRLALNRRNVSRSPMKPSSA
jgi:predicted DsbA family dithiol-disulfide isomerase